MIELIGEEEARLYYAEADSAHGFDHVLRVWRLARRIGAAEGADLTILQAATLLHDVARPLQAETGVCHARAGAERARAILRGHPQAYVEAVANAIAQHRFRGPGDPQGLEARVLYDADKLDAIGAIGVARAYAVAGAHRQRLWAAVDASYAERCAAAGRDDLENAAHTPVHEFTFKLSTLSESLQTETGRRMAGERHRFMVAFFRQLEEEVSGRR